MKRGDVVISTAGKDAQSRFAVVRVEENAVWIADGRLRSIDRPKRKNPRHVTPCRLTVSEQSMVTNRELRRALAALQ